MSEFFEGLGGALGILIVVVALMFIGGCINGEDWEGRAVKAGHAEFYLDDKSAKQWRWKTNCVGGVK